MKRLSADILISGAGVAGLSAACAFGSAGFSVLCVDPAPPVTDAAAAGSDLRTTAFLQPSRSLLERAGLWQQLDPHAAALVTMRIVDAGGDSFEARDIKDFDAADISDAPFGWNLPNWLLRREMLARINVLPNVALLTGIATGHVVTRDQEALVRLSNGKTAVCRLLIGADGRNSPVRTQLGISVRTWRYGQKAMVFAVSHDTPHRNISTEIHRTGGPFTLVPLPDGDGKPRSSVVWMDRGARIKALQTLDQRAFEAEIYDRSARLFGQMHLISRRDVWPIISQHATRLTGARTALIAEAAHVVPPIGAQGLNMSLRDIATLLDLALARPDALGDRQMLDKYQRARMLDIRARVTGIDLLNRAAMAENPRLRDLRRAGLKTLHDTVPVRKILMRAGLGAR